MLSHGNFDVTLTVIDIDGLSANITKSITVGYCEELTVNVDVGSIHFTGELADFYILTSNFGRRIARAKYCFIIMEACLPI